MSCQYRERMVLNEHNSESRRGIAFRLLGILVIGSIGPWFVVLSFLGDSLPEYQDKSAEEWFDASLQARQVDPNDQRSTCFVAFRELEGDAIEFLKQELASNPKWYHELYSAIHRRLPSFLEARMPAPIDQAYFRQRNSTSLELLKMIGQQQRFKAAEGNPSKKPSISGAVPQIIAYLSIDPSAAATALWFIGPPASPAVDKLIVIASDPNSMASTMAIQAFRLIGPSASNAVPLLVSIADDPSHRDRVPAVVALGGLQRSAVSAVPCLVAILETTNQSLRLAAVRSLAEIGTTPDEAMPRLRELQSSPNEWEATLATLALWNRNPQNDQLRNQLVASLNSEKPGPLISVLAQLGTNAAPFKQFIEPFVDDTDANISHFAKRFLYVASQNTE